MMLYTAEEREALVSYYGLDYVRASETIGLRCPDMHMAMATYTPVPPPGSTPKTKAKRPKQRKDPNSRNQRKQRR